MAEALAAAFTDNLLTCSICLGEYEDPRVLPCYHTFCYGCICDHVKRTSSPNRTFLCPVCREKIQFPAGGLSHLKKNFVFSKAKDIITQQQAYTGTIDSEQTNVAAVTQATAEMTINCEKHPDNKLKYYCEDDDTVVCGDCASTEHYRHGIVPVEKLANANRNKVKTALVKILPKLNMFEDAVAKETATEREESRLMTASIHKIKEQALTERLLAMEKIPVPTPDTPAQISYTPGEISAAGLEAMLGQTGHLYITSRGDKCVHVYSTRGQHLTTMGCGRLEMPSGVTLNRQGHVMVCDSSNKSIFTFHAYSGQLLNTIPLSMCEDPIYITVNSVNDNIVISDWGSNSVHVLSPTGNQLYQYGTYGSGDGQLGYPHGVCTDSYGHIFIAAYYNHKIVALSPQGQFITNIATAEDGLWCPMTVPINPAGQLVVTDEAGEVRTFQYLR
ncbi:tripartite motif-containing protein 3-like [Lingula anatina]|uniref:Tripartite motif-containing protein 3-like n=1 Tax=Lingula anatina TaxID=7574 RepID=A0A1S3K857_LINAN|nr:tripartite motif-containing protein 3-like [Lingula anatina]|eukprot:XP_013418624.1 tripartite motif-containing protein 3-like [Lingula anatina]